jgi:plasmid maintenance system antidote protein VapI
LAQGLGTRAGFWLNLQIEIDVATAEKAIGKALTKIVPISKEQHKSIARRLRA